MAEKISMDVIQPDHQVILAQESKLLAVFDDVSRFAIKGSDSVSYPTIAPHSNEAIGIADPFVDENNNYGQDILLLDTVLGGSFTTKLNQDEQNIFNGIEVGLKEKLRLAGWQADKKIYTALRAACEESYVVPTADLYKDISDLAVKLDERNVPSTDRVLVCAPATMGALRNVKDFVRFDAMGTEKISSGQVGEIMGFTVIVTNVVGAGNPIAAHRKALSHAMQGEWLYMEQDDAKKRERTTSVSRNFGCKANQAGATSDESQFAVRLGAAPV